MSPTNHRRAHLGSLFSGAKVSPQPLGLDPVFNVPTNFETPKASSSIFLPDAHAPFMPSRTVHRKLLHMLHPRDYALSDSPEDFIANAISVLRLSHLTMKPIVDNFPHGTMNRIKLRPDAWRGETALRVQACHLIAESSTITFSSFIPQRFSWTFLCPFPSIHSLRSR
jgi:hypothetical protein